MYRIRDDPLRRKKFPFLFFFPVGCFGILLVFLVTRYHPITCKKEILSSSTISILNFKPVFILFDLRLFDLFLDSFIWLLSLFFSVPIESRIIISVKNASIY